MRWWGVIALVALSFPAGAQTLAAPDAIARYKSLTSVAPPRCGLATARDEIVVCAEDTMHSQRLPLPEERVEPGTRPSLVLGEVPSASNAFRTPCPPRGCPCPPSECGIGAIIRKLSGE